MKDEIIQKLIDLAVAYQLAAKTAGLSENNGWKQLSEIVDEIVYIMKSNDTDYSELEEKL